MHKNKLRGFMGAAQDNGAGTYERSPLQGFRHGVAVVSSAIRWWLLLLLASFPIANAYAGFLNGGFESDLANWNVTSYTNPSTISTFPPVQEADLGLGPTGSNGLTYAVGSGADGNTGGVVKYPAYGNKAVVVNYGGNNFRSSAIDQTAAMTVADIDPSDGKVHIRFSIAPVLMNPGHAANQQPYFFVEITNVTKSTQLFHTFNFSGQAGVPWVTFGQYQYTNWQTIDVAPGPGVLDVGDVVKVKIIASGCGQGGHEGHVYVDSGPTATTLPGPYISASGPTSASNADGTQITYTYTYGNSGTAPLTGTVVTAVSPQDNSGTPKNLTFVSSTAPPGNCTFPAVGSAGTVQCNFGTLNPNNTGSFTVTYALPASATGPVNNGNYSIGGDNAPPVLGPLVQTALTGGSLADLSVTITDGVTATTWGSTLTYTIVVRNDGPSAVMGASLVETLPGTLTGATWTCVGASCPNSSGSGAINESGTINLAPGDYLTYTLTATATGSGTGTVSNTVRVSTPGGITDSDTANNTIADVDNVGDALVTLTVNKTGASSGTVASVPSGVNVSCAGNCSGNADFTSGTQVVLYASAPTGSIFAGWSGACSGMASSCTVTMDAAKTVGAGFVAPLNVTTVLSGSGGTVAPGNGVVQPVVPGGSATFTVTPDPGYAPQFSDNCAAGGGATGGSLLGNTYTTNAVAQDCQVTISFTNSGVYTVTPGVGANGSVTPGGATTVAGGGTVSFLVSPGSGYAAATPGGTCPAGTWSGNVYTTGAVTGNCSVDFTFVSGYPITYDANGAGFGTAPTSQTKAAGVDLTLAGNSGGLARLGYTFAGWNTAADGSGTDYAAGATYGTDAGLTLYAKWVLNAYPVTYDANGATSGSAPSAQNKTPGVNLTLAANSGSLARVGYTFVGWNTAADGSGTDYAAGATYGADASLTLYAKWAVAPATPIPTLSQWAQYMMALLLFGIGGWQLRRTGNHALRCREKAQPPSRG